MPVHPDRAGRLLIRPATRADIDAFCTATGCNRSRNPTLRAWAGELADSDGPPRIVGLGGIYVAQGRWFGFIDLDEEARVYRMTIARTMKRFLDAVRKDGIRFIYAEASLEEKGAAWRLKRLGFAVDPRSQVLYRWSAQSEPIKSQASQAGRA